MAEQKFRTRGTPQDWVEIGHDGIEGTARVAPQALAHWESRGWKAVDATGTSATDAGATPPAKSSRTAATGTES